MAVHQYVGTVRGDKYPVEFQVEGGLFSTAVHRMVRQWEKGKGKRSRTAELVVRIVRLDREAPPAPAPIAVMPPRRGAKGWRKKAPQLAGKL